MKNHLSLVSKLEKQIADMKSEDILFEGVKEGENILEFY